MKKSPASKRSPSARRRPAIAIEADGTAGRWISEAEFARLNDQLREAQESLEAIRNGEVDAVVVKTTSGHQIYSLNGAEQRYRVYVEHMQEGAVTVTHDGLVLYCNLRYAEMLKTPLERVIGSSLATGLSTEAWETVSAVFSGPDKIVKHECQLQCSDGGSLAVHLTASWLPTDGENVLCIVVTDLTAQKSQQELRLARDLAERSSLAKDAFLAALSHELRTPLTPALLATAALEERTDLPETVRGDLAMIRRNIELEARLIDDLLDLTRIASGKLELHSSPIDVHAVVRCALEICRADLEQKRLHCELNLRAREIATVGDAIRLQQALWNLISNAIKFTAPGGQVTISTGNSSPGSVWVEVSDTGIGFEPETSLLLFKAFEQGGRHVTRQFGGLGLGLAISSSILAAHGGTIRAESRGPHLGASFTAEWPLRPALAFSAPPADAAVTASNEARCLRILLVEDHADTRKTLERYLTSVKNDVTSAATAREALALAEGQTFDLVVSDLGLPDEGGGLAMMRQLRAVHGLRGIAVSGYGMADDVIQSRGAGFIHHLTKPINLEQLKSLILEVANTR